MYICHTTESNLPLGAKLLANSWSATKSYENHEHPKRCENEIDNDALTRGREIIDPLLLEMN